MSFRSSAYTGTLRAIIIPMNIETMLRELREEREGVEQAILVLEGIASGRGKRRGRPPAWMASTKKRGRPKGSRNKPKDAD
jgi:hypothetical protein